MQHVVYELDDDSGLCKRPFFWSEIMPRERFLEHNGKRLSIKDWSKETGLHRNTISSRLKHGLSVAGTLSSIDDQTGLPLSTSAAHTARWAQRRKHRADTLLAETQKRQGTRDIGFELTPALAWRLYYQGWKQDWIASYFKVSKSLVSLLLCSLPEYRKYAALRKLLRRRGDPETALKLLCDGLAPNEIAEIFECHPGTVLRHLRKIPGTFPLRRKSALARHNSIAAKGIPRSPEVVAKIRAMVPIELIPFEGINRSRAEWAKAIGINLSAFNARLAKSRKGDPLWPIERVFLTNLDSTQTRHPDSVYTGDE